MWDRLSQRIKLTFYFLHSAKASENFKKCWLFVLSQLHKLMQYLHYFSTFLYTITNFVCWNEIIFLHNDNSVGKIKTLKFCHFDTNIQIIMTSFLAEDCNVISVDWRDLAGPAPWYDVIRQVRFNPKGKPYNYKASLLG